jgi:hypothetical protein
MIRILALSIALLAAPAWAAWDLDQLMKSLGANKASRATFVEKKYLAMLDAPVTSSGELLFTPPDRLERRTLKPRPESVVLEAGVMTMTRGQRQMVLQLQEYPAVAALTESIRATLAGDRQALEKHYTIKTEGTQDRWALVLVPREPRTRALVLEIRIEGERGEVRTVEIEQSDKDRSVMTIQKAPAS